MTIKELKKIIEHLEQAHGDVSDIPILISDGFNEFKISEGLYFQISKKLIFLPEDKGLIKK